MVDSNGEKAVKQYKGRIEETNQPEDFPLIEI